jgi:DNA-binding transcriptional MerR regulator
MTGHSAVMADPTGRDASARGAAKSAAAFRTIAEVAADLDLPQHVLRFWESKFQQVRPLKRGGGRRYYRPEDVAVLRRIRDLLHEEGYTIRGAQKLLRQKSPRPSAPTVSTPVTPPAEPPPRSVVPKLDPRVRAVLEEVEADLETLRRLLLDHRA